MSEQKFKTLILLACLVVLVYIAGYTVGEFSAYWHLADAMARKATAKAVRKFEPPESEEEK